MNQTVTTEVSVTTTMIRQDVRTVMQDIWVQPAMMNVFTELLMPTIPCVFVHRPAITVLVAILNVLDMEHVMEMAVVTVPTCWDTVALIVKFLVSSRIQIIELFNP